VLAEEDLALAVGAWSVGQFTLPTTVATPVDPAREVLVVRLGTEQAVHTWAEDVDLALAPDPLRASVTPVQDGYRVDVTASSLARDVTLLVDRLDPDALVDAALVDLPAGATASFHVRTRGAFDPADLTRAPVLRSANDVVVPRLPRPGARDLTGTPA
jgi:beta-mannosidase